MNLNNFILYLGSKKESILSQALLVGNGKSWRQRAWPDTWALQCMLSQEEAVPLLLSRLLLTCSSDMHLF